MKPAASIHEARAWWKTARRLFAIAVLADAPDTCDAAFRLARAGDRLAPFLVPDTEDHRAFRRWRRYALVIANGHSLHPAALTRLRAVARVPHPQQPEQTNDD